MNPKLEEFIRNLLEGTRSGALKWTETAEPRVYRLMLDKGLVRIYPLGPMSVGENFVGCTVLDAKGNVINDDQVLRTQGGPLVSLYDYVDGNFQAGALDDLLAEVRTKIQDSNSRATAGQR
jgi:hypothetical protein